MPSLQAKIAMWIFEKDLVSWSSGSIEEQRAKLEKATQLFRLPRGIRYEPCELQGIPAAWFECPDSKPGVILYLHGGAYVIGSIKGHREYLARLAKATCRKVLAIDYRLAPEHPFPAALEDALSAYHWLIAEGFPPSQIALAGDSAGGGLALATLLALRDEGEVLPACGVCVSPWVDLTLSSPSIQSKASADPILSQDSLAIYAGYYAGDLAQDHHLISPLFAQLGGLPPLLIHVSSEEILLDEAVQFTHQAQAAGVAVELKTWKGLYHVFQITPFLPESKLSLEQIGVYIAAHMNPGGDD